MLGGGQHWCAACFGGCSKEWAAVRVLVSRIRVLASGWRWWRLGGGRPGVSTAGGWSMVVADLGWWCHGRQ